MRAQRRVAWLALAIYAIAQWVAFAHEAHVQHVRCAEHGELVEAPASLVADASPAFAFDADANDTAHARAHERRDASSLPDDEHCGFAESSPPALAPSHQVRREIAFAPRRIAIARLREVLPAWIPILVIAPKTSPPRPSSAESSLPCSLTHTDEVLVCVRPSFLPHSRFPSRSPLSPAVPRSYVATSGRSSTRPAAA